jgi:hypothetical protein
MCLFACLPVSLCCLPSNPWLVYCLPAVCPCQLRDLHHLGPVPVVQVRVLPGWKEKVPKGGRVLVACCCINELPPSSRWTQQAGWTLSHLNTWPPTHTDTGMCLPMLHHLAHVQCAHNYCAACGITGQCQQCKPTFYLDAAKKCQKVRSLVRVCSQCRSFRAAHYAALAAKTPTPQPQQ